MVERGAEPLDPIEGGDLLGVFAGVFRFPETCDVRRATACHDKYGIPVQQYSGQT